MDAPNTEGPNVNEDAVAPPPTPRDLSRRVRQRAWVEPRVRFWWVSALVVVLIGIWFVIDGLITRAHEAWLIKTGLSLNATILEAGGATIKNRSEAPDSIVVLNFPWRDTVYSPKPRKLEGRKDFIVTGSLLPIHVNPKDPEDWTSLDAPMPLLTHVMGGMIAFPIGVVAFMGALLYRGRLLHAWRDGPALRALVVDTTATAIAPRIKVARVTPQFSGDDRIYTVYLPAHLAQLESGDLLYILRPSAQSSSTIAAAWFD